MITEEELLLVEFCRILDIYQRDVLYWGGERTIPVILEAIEDLDFQKKSLLDLIGKVSIMEKAKK